MRTNIEINDELMRQAMVATNTTTKKAAVEASMRKLIDVKAREKARNRIMKLQEEARLQAIREGHLDQWYEELKRTGNQPEEEVYANQH